MSTNYKTTSAVQLQNIIKEMGSNLTGVELGVWFGYNCGHLLEECPNISMLYGIDPYLEYQDWNRYLDNNIMKQARESANTIFNKFDSKARLIEYKSEEAVEGFVKGGLDFIFIDGDHSYEMCYKDLNLWYSKVKSGGLFSGHDFSLPGVNKALLQFRTEQNIKGFFKVIPNDVWYWIKD